MIVCLLLMTHFNCIHCQAAGLLQEVSEIGMEVFGFHDLHDFQDQKRLHGFAMEKRRGVKLGVFGGWFLEAVKLLIGMVAI